jgi:hypothetical protein
MNDKKNVICIKWGTRYPADYANRLYNMVTGNSCYPIDFYCFTEDSEGLDDRIIVKPLPDLKGKPEDPSFAYQKEAGLCDDDLGGLNGQRVLFFDLDVIIVDNIDGFFEFPDGDDFVIINDWNSPGDNVGQASCYSFVVGTLGYIKQYFEEHPEEVVEKFYTASQEYLSDQVIKKRGALKFWPSDWCRSFRFDCLPWGPLRLLLMPQIPKGAKLIVFHGSPNPHEAYMGKWSTEFHVPLLKRWYKTVRKTPWVGEYWR